MTYIVLKGYLHDPIDCVTHAVATEPARIYRKDILSFVMNYWHQSYILSLFCGPRRKGAQRQEDCNMRVEKEVNLFQIYNMGSGNAMWLDFHVDPNKLSFLQ
ncbi:hypothetical protein HN873_067608, partial [Arachis hypogaea]